ncbi:MAG: hypothetical protein IJ489_11855 [Clostridia bacterium]|nr:hypothetical protein [Clostridia bacterium]
MKKFIIITISVILLAVFADFMYWRGGIWVDLRPFAEVTAESRVHDGKIQRRTEDGWEDFEIRGVNLGSSEPGAWAIDFPTDEETYLRWFEQMSEMGANTVRIYTVMSDTFYNAFYTYNQDREEPLYLIQGVALDDNFMGSRHDAFSEEFYDAFYEHCEIAVDVIHGAKKISEKQISGIGYGTYSKDISAWTIGYIFGTDWNAMTVAYADDIYEGYSYQGEYLYSAEDASAFEALLASVGDGILSYESERYKEQRVFAFTNSLATDPFLYTDFVNELFAKCAFIDVEHILSTDKVLSGQFASYHVYPYYPDYLNYYSAAEWELLDIGEQSLYLAENGKFNTYKAYLQLLNKHHSLPVVIAEYGLPSSRGIAQEDLNTGRDQGYLSEKEQGEAIVACYEDIKDAGCIGSCVSSWQDEWYRSSRSSAATSNPLRTAFWSDAQAPEQSMGLLAMEAGEGECVCYPDGDISEWTEDDIVSQNKKGSISVKTDEKYFYIMIENKDFVFDEDVLYIPIDTTQKSGSNYCENYDVKFDRAADFLIVIDGENNSRIVVQERYEVLRATDAQRAYGFDTYTVDNIPEKDSPLFKKIQVLLRKWNGEEEEYYFFETGKLTYGNANPESTEFSSLADFCHGEGTIEIRLPWSILNFYDPTLRMIHNDYYEHYGIKELALDKLYIGFGLGKDRARIDLLPFRPKTWTDDVTYHERLKESYYILQDAWTED